MYGDSFYILKKAPFPGLPCCGKKKDFTQEKLNGNIETSCPSIALVGTTNKRLIFLSTNWIQLFIKIILKEARFEAHLPKAEVVAKRPRRTAAIFIFILV